jgi:hypothetical protein
MKWILKIWVCSMVLTGVCAGKDKPVNILLIVADDLGIKDLGCYGSDFYRTPNLDKLVTQGMRFTRAYAACPVCSPTRASILTGRYPQRVQLTDALPWDRLYKNPKMVPPDHLKELPSELFNRKTDPGEKTDLAAKESAQLKRLTVLLESHLKDSKSQRMTQNPDWKQNQPKGKARNFGVFYPAGGRKWQPIKSPYPKWFKKEHTK